jgi:hypothetical protein
MAKTPFSGVSPVSIAHDADWRGHSEANIPPHGHFRQPYGTKRPFQGETNSRVEQAGREQIED